ncbi:MAG: hypothetical protein HY698_04595 [Deltaproteobacteria bacterium]|nr:hypothetical protein [Deltaproteobacteria bacterium]
MESERVGIGRARTRDRLVAVLLNGGDWACGHGDYEALEIVAAQLASLLPPRLSQLADHVAFLARGNSLEAALAWGRLAAAVRSDRTGVERKT